MIGSRTGILVLACLLSACGGGSGDTAVPTRPSGDDPDEAQVLPRVDVRGTNELYVYRADSPYADVLKECALVEVAAAACRLTVLPFITQATPDFDREDILDRLLVTHDWMGKRFEQLLADAPEHMVTLFGSLTSIAIGSTVRPSNYWGGTGGIQLDPENLWLSTEEKANVSIEEDYRSAYGKDLTFWSFGTLRKGDQPASYYYSLTNNSERTLADITLPMYRLLYHELAHAVDYLPGESIAMLDSSLTPSAALDANEQFWLSPRLYLDQPLYSEELYALAQVSFRGKDASAEQTLFTPAYVGSLMANDGAAKYYGYSTWREDFATLFATAMIKQDFDVDYYMAFVQKPVDEDDYECSELTVGWGVKNRIADPLVIPRAKRVMESVYGSTAEIDELFARGIGQQTGMTEGLDWCSNRDGEQGSLTKRPDSALSSEEKADSASRARLQLERERRDYTH